MHISFSFFNCLFFRQHLTLKTMVDSTFYYEMLGLHLLMFSYALVYSSLCRSCVSTNLMYKYRTEISENNSEWLTSFESLPPAERAHRLDSNYFCFILNIKDCLWNVRSVVGWFVVVCFRE